MTSYREATILAHLDELEALPGLREQALDAPHYHAADLVELDARIEAHLDGVRLSGATGLEVAAEDLPQASAFVAGALLVPDALAARSSPGPHRSRRRRAQLGGAGRSPSRRLCARRGRTCLGGLPRR